MVPRLLRSLPALGLLAVSLFSAGCLKMGPDWEGPPPVIGKVEGFQHAGSGDAAFQERDRWWEAFGDPEINRLVERALKRNWDLNLATAQVLEAAAGFHQAQSQRLPHLGLSGDASRSQSSNGGFFPAHAWASWAPPTATTSPWAPLLSWTCGAA